MSQQDSNYGIKSDNQEPMLNPMDLLFDEQWLRKAVEAEDLVNGNIGAGLDWGSKFGELILNPELFGRLKTLRISLNREVRLMINDWNLGTAAKIAASAGRERLLLRLRLPASDVQEHIQTVLQRDDLYGEEFISNRQVLRELISVMLKQEDWEKIATVAADSLKAQIMHQSIEKISA